MEAHKDDKKKRSGYSLLPRSAVAAVVDVLSFGAKKYAPDNWKGLDPERIYDAFNRHLDAIHEGEVCDAESGLPHWAHVACNALFMTWFHLEGRLGPRIGAPTAEKSIGVGTSAMDDYIKALADKSDFGKALEKVTPSAAASSGVRAAEAAFDGEETGVGAMRFYRRRRSAGLEIVPDGDTEFVRCTALPSDRQNRRCQVEVGHIGLHYNGFFGSW